MTWRFRARLAASRAVLAQLQSFLYGCRKVVALFRTAIARNITVSDSAPGECQAPSEGSATSPHS